MEKPHLGWGHPKVRLGETRPKKAWTIFGYRLL
jgi:hypothetical protein